MWVKQRRQQASGTREDDDDTSRLPCVSDQHSSSTRFPGSQQSGFKKDKVREVYMQKMSHHKVKLPPIKAVHVSKTSVQPDLIRELRYHVCDLQQQLGEARNENKLLKQVQHRHMMALQHFQQAEDSIEQIMTKHNNEARAHHKLLGETRICRENLIRQLQATGNELFKTKVALQHLEQLSKDQHLLEREELIQRLAKATAELENKNKRIQDMERNLKLCQASFKHQIMAEERKVKEARNLTYHLQSRIYELTTQIQYREKEMEKNNIYAHRFLKGSSKKGRENKRVQTDGLLNVTTNSSRLLEMECPESKDTADKQEIAKNMPCSNEQQKALITENPEKKVSDGEVTLQEDTESETEMCSGSAILIKKHTSENNTEKSLERTSKHHILNFIIETEETEALPDKKQEKTHETSVACTSEKTHETSVACTSEKTHETSVACTSEKSLNSKEAKKNEHKVPKTRHNYSFKRSTENLHNGLPAYSERVMTAEILSLDIKDISLQDGKFRGGED